MKCVLPPFHNFLMQTPRNLCFLTAPPARKQLMLFFVQHRVQENSSRCFLAAPRARKQLMLFSCSTACKKTAHAVFLAVSDVCEHHLLFFFQRKLFANIACYFSCSIVLFALLFFLQYHVCF